MKAKISVFVICVEAIIFLLLYNLHDCTFNNGILSLKSATCLVWHPWVFCWWKHVFHMTSYDPLIEGP